MENQRFEKETFKVDKEGFVVEKKLTECDRDGNVLENVVGWVAKPFEGLYRARWNGIEWIEDMTQEEIDALNNQPSLPSVEERLQMAEDTLIFLLMGGM